MFYRRHFFRKPNVNFVKFLVVETLKRHTRSMNNSITVTWLNKLVDEYIFRGFIDALTSHRKLTRRILNKYGTCNIHNIRGRIKRNLSYEERKSEMERERERERHEEKRGLNNQM